MKVSILGAGSWGTALAVGLAKNNHEVKIWVRDNKKAEQINCTHENTEYLPGAKIPENVLFTADFNCVKDSDFIVIAVPTHSVREISKDLARLIDNQIIINVAKGIENGTLKTMSQVTNDELPSNKVVVLYGPSHAEEVSRDIPTTIVAASRNIDAAKAVQDLFMSPDFRVYTNTDVIGVEIGGSIKNVIALCAGISDGLGFGDNTKAALMTRGLAEIARLGVAMGADPLTFAGLSGVGDLIVTCTSMHSRNRRCGILLGQGKSLQEAQEEVHMVVEGVRTTRSAYDLSRKLGIEMPITVQAYDILFNGKNPREAVYDLMMRDRKDE